MVAGVSIFPFVVPASTRFLLLPSPHSTRPHSFLRCTAEHQSRPCTLATHSGYLVDAWGCRRQHLRTTSSRSEQAKARAVAHANNNPHRSLHACCALFCNTEGQEGCSLLRPPLPQQGQQILFGQVSRALDPAACISAYSCRGILDRKPSPARIPAVAHDARWWHFKTCQKVAQDLHVSRTQR